VELAAERARRAELNLEPTLPFPNFPSQPSKHVFLWSVDYSLPTWLIRPWRAEPIYLLSKEIKDWTKKYYILKLCSNIDYPKDDVLFIEYNIYEGEILDELAVAAYWLDKTKESIEILDRLILTNYGNKTKERLLVNREFAVKKANSLYQ
jgi:hypothetical protein